MCHWYYCCATCISDVQRWARIPSKKWQRLSETKYNEKYTGASWTGSWFATNDLIERSTQKPRRKRKKKRRKPTVVAAEEAGSGDAEAKAADEPKAEEPAPAAAEAKAADEPDAEEAGTADAEGKAADEPKAEEAAPAAAEANAAEAPEAAGAPSRKRARPTQANQTFVKLSEICRFVEEMQTQLVNIKGVVDTLMARYQ